MDSNKKSKILIIDTSALLSGKQMIFNNDQIVTTTGVSNELKPGGKDYQNFQYLLEKGLKILTPSDSSLDKIKKVSTKSGDIARLSKTDIEILALALDLKNKNQKEIIILTDDYSIQNVANILNIVFQSISQQGIKKRFKWVYCCRGCGKKFEEHIKVCPICGTEIRYKISKKTNLVNRDIK